MKQSLKTNLLKVIIIFSVIFVDLLTKHFLYESNFILIPGLIGGRYSSLNTGGAWSILNDKMWLLILLSMLFVVVAVVFDIFFKTENKVYSFAFGFVLGGTIGNLIDRLFLGGVRDFLYFEFWPTYPTFNFADVFLLFGMILLFVFVIFIYKPEQKR